jgi:LysR family glycine cleavage system transcriptional activator
MMPRVSLTMTQDWRGVLAEELGPDVLVPVRSRALASRPGPGEGAQEIGRLPLIHTATRPHAWPDWMRAQGLPYAGAARTNEFGHFFMSLEAARQGLGVALVPDILLETQLGQDLEALTSYKVRSAAEYYLLSLGERANERPISLFRRWLREEFGARSAALAAPAAPAIAR